MLNFQLFRIKVHPSQPRDLFKTEKTRPEMLRETIASLPAGEFRAGLTWHVGNVIPIDHAGLYFRFGRTSTSTLEIYDQKMGSFVDQEFETAPYTHIVVDIEMELSAIARKPRLSPTTSGIARQLMRLLNESKKAVEFEATFEIDDIKDPEDFISHLKRAYSISKFSVFFSRLNAFDANKDFVKPLQGLLEASNGEKGKAELKGKALKSEILEAVARSAAATGDDATALIRPDMEAAPVMKRLRGSAAVISQEGVADKKEQRQLLERVRTLYRKIRGEGGQ